MASTTSTAAQEEEEDLDDLAVANASLAKEFGGEKSLESSSSGDDGGDDGRRRKRKSEEKFDLGDLDVSWDVRERDGARFRLRRAVLALRAKLGCLVLTSPQAGGGGGHLRAGSSGKPPKKRPPQVRVLVLTAGAVAHEAVTTEEAGRSPGDFGDQSRGDAAADDDDDESYFEDLVGEFPASSDVQFFRVRRFAASPISVVVDVGDEHDYLALIHPAPEEVWTAIFRALLHYQTVHALVLPLVLASARTSVMNVDRLLADQPQRRKDSDTLPVGAVPTCVFDEGAGFRLLVGNLGSALSKEFVEEERVGGVINLSLSDNVCDSDPSVRKRVRYLRVDIDDKPDAKISPHFAACVELIKEVASDDVPCLVHCQAGRSRSVSICIAYLIAERGMSLADALVHIRRRRLITPNKGFCKALLKWEKASLGRNTMHWPSDWDGLQPLASSRREKKDCAVM